MATTPNYGWVMPDPTNLVKDLPVNFETFGDAVDSTVKANADAAINKTIVDAKGDLIVATAADTVARLAVGANNTVLMADSATASGVKWGTVASGGIVQLATVNLSGSIASSFTGINQSYRDLHLIVQGATTSLNFAVTIESNSFSLQLVGPRSNSGGSATTSNALNLGTQQFSANATSIFTLDVYNYTSSTFAKPVRSSGYFVNPSGTGIYTNGQGAIAQTAAITTIIISNDQGVAFTGGTATLYGVS